MENKSQFLTVETICIKYSIKLENIIETILHEIAHAMTSGEGHFIEWQIKAIELGLSYEHIQRYKEL